MHFRKIDHHTYYVLITQFIDVILVQRSEDTDPYDVIFF
jgi:hypothetical protein